MEIQIMTPCAPQCRKRKSSRSNNQTKPKLSSLHNCLMTSSAHELSDNNEVDEQKKHSEFSNHSSSPVTGLSPSSITTRYMPYTTPQHAVKAYNILPGNLSDYSNSIKCYAYKIF
ncbi:nuclear transcription factor Y subunit A-7-like [Gossypium australe]|uniref:Nuclear transcription factor Y subunit A-7-like n=1 Tax=Gossypium australe TaxID=47621 RepID=A0A5B6X5P5_9ROSI|nr:nuclear transcription factor Y subunit A-7-like [Gossypium australe]